MEWDELVGCPYCGEPIELELDEGGGTEQSYVEDCWVCCRPITVHVSVDEDGGTHVSVQTQDE